MKSAEQEAEEALIAAGQRYPFEGEPLIDGRREKQQKLRRYLRHAPGD